MSEMSYEIEGLQKKLITLFFSGIYITSKDLIDMAEQLDIELPSKDREILMKYLFSETVKTQQTDKLLSLIVELLNIRIEEYKSLTISFPAIAKLSTNWINRANSIKAIIFAQKRRSIYE